MAASDKAQSKLGAIVDDLISLDVVTFSGNLEVKLTDINSGPNGTIDLENVMKNLKGTVTGGKSTLTAVATTYLAIDKDSVQFVKTDLTPGEERIYALHLEAVKTAVAARAAMVESLMRIAGLNK